MTASASNALLLDGSGSTGCHGWVESHRAEARYLGLLVPQHADPRTIPVHLAIGVVLLTEDGTYATTEGATA